MCKYALEISTRPLFFLYVASVSEERISRDREDDVGVMDLVTMSEEALNTEDEAVDPTFDLD